MTVKPNVKFSNKGQLFVDVPYKNGMVTWAVNFHNSKCEWILFDKPEKYSPDRVSTAHKNILKGKKLRSLMISKAAATHSYVALEKLKSVRG